MEELNEEDLKEFEGGACVWLSTGQTRSVGKNILEWLLPSPKAGESIMPELSCIIDKYCKMLKIGRGGGTNYEFAIYPGIDMNVPVWYSGSFGQKTQGGKLRIQWKGRRIRFTRSTDMFRGIEVVVWDVNTSGERSCRHNDKFYWLT